MAFWKEKPRLVIQGSHCVPVLIRENARMFSLSFVKFQMVVLRCSLIFVGRHNIASRIPPHVHQPRCDCKHVPGPVVMVSGLKGSSPTKFCRVLHQHVCSECCVGSHNLFVALRFTDSFCSVARWVPYVRKGNFRRHAVVWETSGVR